MKKNIKELKKENNAIILAHYYQMPEIQDIADYVGDSYALAKYAQNTDADWIILAGVKFMAETAKVLNPNKRVFVPDINAGCSLVDAAPVDKFKKWIDSFENPFVVTYINSSIEVKMLSDVIVTSSNAVKIVSKIPKDKTILFAPDKNLGDYVMKKTGVNMQIWDGNCYVHNQLDAKRIINLKNIYPDATIIAHPECKTDVLDLCDFVGSTNSLLNYVKNTNYNVYIVATETGILHQMKKAKPNADFILVTLDDNSKHNDCKYMKLNTLEKIYDNLINQTNEILLSEAQIERAKISILRMIEFAEN
ncbi:MAG: quinolinate synthase NadA [Bacteroidales bacterium]|jgi:quinolinate synthase|nr:quinolinate synthase NadA [Bacteroidales bacterium]MDY0401495.1 quinolinate synthase NadA [Bacteroidales bacterium]HOB78081.1 quinolinate synthase NadA [Bacteroidales bacterium]HPZ61541.1 quinolinate synthase NadA [Bacteroidales bacterium]HQD59221.1 quinolinate synthase NadA [Bacteroidales bacterium]